MSKLNSFSFLYINVLIGENGTIDGQGDAWWNMWRNRTLQFTRPNLVEFVNSKDIIISNVIFKDSPFWNIHPVYCRYMSNITHFIVSNFKSAEI
jgi:polygalacturonase